MHLRKITIKRSDGIGYSFSIHDDSPRKDVDVDTFMLNLSLEDSSKLFLKEGFAKFTVLHHFEDIPENKHSGLGKSWEKTKRCCVSFAIQKENNSYTSLVQKCENKIRVYFPTEEAFYLPFLFHATYFTDIARKNIDTNIPYNLFLTKIGVDAFLRYLLEVIQKDNEKDPGKHLDFFSTKIKPKELLFDSEDNNIGRLYLRELFERLPQFSLFPINDGNPHPIATVSLLERERKEWNDWYTLLGEDICNNLSLIHLCCRTENRFKLIEYFKQTVTPDEDIIKEINNVPDEAKTTEWCVKAYFMINELYNKADWQKKKVLEKIYPTLQLIRVTDGSFISGVSNYKIFMPPTSDRIPTPPEWLKIKFVDPSLIKNIQAKAKEKRKKLFTRYFEYLNVKQYVMREIIRECAAQDLESYWTGENSVLNPHELLQFLYNLLKDSRRIDEPPVSQIERHLKNIPVPSYTPLGDEVWSRAGETYASSEWTGNKVLEELYSYDEKSKFLSKKADFSSEIDKWDIFFKWLGVSWAPRIVNLSSPENYYNISKPRTNQLLRGWSKYANLIENIEYNDNGDTINDGRIELEQDFIIDRFFEICDNKERQKVMLNYFAENPSSIDDIGHAKIQYKPYGQRAAQYKTLRTNYQSWCIKNIAWLYSDSIEEKFVPSALCIPTNEITKTLGNYAKYVDYNSEVYPAEWNNMRSFLIRSGLSDSIEQFTLTNWYNILGNIEHNNPNLSEEETGKIRGLYRKFIDSPSKIENNEKLRNNFIVKNKVLVKKDGIYSFVSPTSCYYVDKTSFGDKFEKYVPCFEVRINRSKRIFDLFGINSLTKSVETELDIGTTDKGLIDPLNNFLDRAKPFILARIRSQRTDKGDSGRLSRLQINPATKINVRYGLKESEKIKWLYNGEVDSFIDQKNHILYINARIILGNISTPDDLYKEKQAIQEIADGIRELLEIDLSEAFQLILGMNYDERKQFLMKSGVTNEILQECQIEIIDPEENLNDPPAESPAPPTPYVSGSPLVQDGGRVSPQTPPTPPSPQERKIWGREDEEFCFTKIVIPPLNKPSGVGGGSGGGNPPIQRNPEIRKRTDSAGMKIVMKYEVKENRHPTDVSTQAQRLARKDSPGCDIHSHDEKGKLVRMIEVKSSMSEVSTLEFTHTEWDTARNQYNGEMFYLYRVSKLDKEKYPAGPELLLIQDPYGKGLDAVPSGYRIKIDPTKGELFKASIFLEEN